MFWLIHSIKDPVPLSSHLATLSLLAGSLSRVPGNTSRQQHPEAEKESFPSIFSLKEQRNPSQRRSSGDLLHISLTMTASHARPKPVVGNGNRIIKMADIKDYLPSSLSCHTGHLTPEPKWCFGKKDEGGDRQLAVPTRFLFLAPMSNQSPQSANFTSIVSLGSMLSFGSPSRRS